MTAPSNDPNSNTQQSRTDTCSTDRTGQELNAPKSSDCSVTANSIRERIMLLASGVSSSRSGIDIVVQVGVIPNPATPAAYLNHYQIPGMPNQGVNTTTNQLDAQTQVERIQTPNSTTVTVTTRSHREAPVETAKSDSAQSNSPSKEQIKSVAKEADLSKESGDTKREDKPTTTTSERPAPTNIDKDNTDRAQNRLDTARTEVPRDSESSKLTKLNPEPERTIGASLAQAQTTLKEPTDPITLNQRPDASNNNDPLKLDPKVERANEIENRRNELNDARARVNDQLEVVRQVISNEIARDTTDASLRNGSVLSDTPISATRYDPSPNTSLAIERLRESLLDKLSVIEERIATPEPIKQQHQAISSDVAAPIQGRLDARTQEPIRHDLKRETALRQADRSEQAQPKPLHRVLEPLIGKISDISHNPASYQAKSAQRYDQRGKDTLDNLIELLKHLSLHSTNFKLLKAMDTPLEQVCLALATGVAVGAVGIEYLVKALYSTLAETGMVVDITGVVIGKSDQRPLANVEVNEPRLGRRVTDQEGRFVFSNVALNTPYTLTITHPILGQPELTVSGTATPGGVVRIEV
jgi:hypothetical protein